MSTPPLDETQLVETKHGLKEFDQRELAKTALYWIDEARQLQLLLQKERSKRRGRSE